MDGALARHSAKCLFVIGQNPRSVLIKLIAIFAQPMQAKLSSSYLALCLFSEGPLMDNPLLMLVYLFQLAVIQIAQTWLGRGER